jgi:hypothetical protein
VLSPLGLVRSNEGELILIRFEISKDEDGSWKIVLEHGGMGTLLWSWERTAWRALWDGIAKSNRFTPRRK